MCRMLLEVGDYASTILDKTHQAFSRKCLSLNKKVENELLKRKAVASSDEVYNSPFETIDSSDLSSLSIDQLETLYRQWKIRFNERLKDHRESLTRFFETRIIREMKRRNNLTATEQLKVDYCERTNRDELQNISAITRMPLGNAYLDIDRCKTPQEMLGILEKLRRYKNVSEREMLIDTTDKAIDFIESNRDNSHAVNLAAELVELNRCRIISSPEWIEEYLMGTVDKWEKRPFDFDREKILPYLSSIRDNKARWRAVRTLNTGYERALAFSTNDETLSDAIEDLYMAELCCTYVSKYNVRKLAAAWDRLCDYIASDAGFGSLSTAELIKLLFVANEVSGSAPISADYRLALSSQLSQRAASGDFEAEIYTSHGRQLSRGIAKDNVTAV